MYTHEYTHMHIFNVIHDQPPRKCVCFLQVYVESMCAQTQACI